MSRAMQLTVLYRMDGGKDSGTGAAWYSDALSWAVEGRFRWEQPRGQRHREQLATILYAHAGSPAPAAERPPMATAGRSLPGRPMPWPGRCLAACISGKPGSLLDPQGTATRAEVAAILMRFVEQNAITQGQYPIRKERLSRRGAPFLSGKGG
jgi:hypothetical protein